MDSSLALILAGLIIFAAHVVAGVTGFGSAILGLPFLALIVGLDVGKQTLLILTCLLCLYLVLRWPKHIDWREFGIMTLMSAIGLPFGIYLYDVLPRRWALIALGLFIAAVGLRNLLQLFPDQRAPRWLAKVLLIVGGVVQGAFTTGGPLLIVYADQTLTNKSSFRVTLCLLWIALDIILAAAWTHAHVWNIASLRLSLFGLPFMIAGLIVGEWLHHKVSERGFRRGVNITLLAIGSLLLILSAA